MTVSAAGNRVYLAMVKSTAADPGTIPTNPTMQKVNFTSETLGFKDQTAISKHINANRRINRIATKSRDVSGSYSFEQQFENSLNDEVLAAMVWGAWADNGDGTFTLFDANTYSPFIIEKGFTDIQQYLLYYGMSASKMTLEYQDKALAIGSYEFKGLSFTVSANPISGATYTDATDNPEMNTTSNIASIKIDGAAITDCQIRDFTIEVDNQITMKSGIGILGACRAIPHKIKVTSKMTAYFQDTVMLNRLLDGDTFSFEWTTIDSLGNKYEFKLPECQLLDIGENVKDDATDVLENRTFMALRDPADDYVLKVVKTPV